MFKSTAKTNSGRSIGGLLLLSPPRPPVPLLLLRSRLLVLYLQRDERTVTQPAIGAAISLPSGVTLCLRDGKNTTQRKEGTDFCLRLIGLDRARWKSQICKHGRLIWHVIADRRPLLLLRPVHLPRRHRDRVWRRRRPPILGFRLPDISHSPICVAADTAK